MRENVAFYDIEIYPNYFCLCVKNHDGKETKYLVNDINNFKIISKIPNLWWCGYNNYNYDNLIISFWLNVSEGDVELIYILNEKLFGHDLSSFPLEKVEIVEKWVKDYVYSKFDNGLTRFGASWNFKQPFGKIIDLFQLNETNGGLKNCGIILNYPNIMETPIAFGTILSNEQFDLIDKYCWSDVRLTEAVYRHMEQRLMVRDIYYNLGIQESYYIPSAQLGVKYIILRHCEKNKLNYNTFYKTITPSIKNDIIPNTKVSELFVYDGISFNDKNIQTITDYLLGCILNYTPGLKNGDKQTHFINSNGDRVLKSELKFNDERGNVYQLGLGGIHSNDVVGIWNETDTHILVNFDVKSYYPSLIEFNKLNPEHIDSLSDTIKEIKTKRFEVKKTLKLDGLSDKQILELKAEDEGLKLIMNSIYGKMNTRGSEIRDPKKAYSVTVSGQLMLLKLIDMVQSKITDCKLINANTDGICYYMNKSDIEGLKSIMLEWEQLSGVQLELEFYSAWCQSSISDYFALESSGKLKTKGGYLLKPEQFSQSLSGSCIRKAVHDKVCFGIDIEDSIRNNKDYTHFLISAGVDKEKFIDGDSVLVEKKIRFVYSKSGSELNILKTDGSIAKFEGGRNLTLLLECEENTFPWSDIDYDIYINQAKKLYYNVICFKTTSGTPGWFEDFMPYYDKLYSQSEEVYNELTAKGLSLMPKVGKNSYFNVKVSDKNTWSLVPKDKSLGWGIVTGPEYNTIAIDIDNPDAVNGELLSLLHEYPSLHIYRGTNNPISGDKGTIIYKYSGENLKSFSLIDKYGIECLYNNKVATVFGVHPSGEYYKYAGELQELPLDIENYLMSIKKIRKGKLEIEIPKEEDIFLDKNRFFSVLKREFGDIEALSEEQQEDKSIKYTFDYNGHWFVGYLRTDGTAYLHTNHANFQSTVLSPLNDEFKSLDFGDYEDTIIITERKTDKLIMNNDKVISDIILSKKYPINSTSKFPFEVLPDKVQELISASCANPNLIPEFMAGTFLYIASSIIGLSHKVNYDGVYQESACLWISGVAKAGLGKSGSIKSMDREYRKINIENSIAFNKQYADSKNKPKTPNMYLTDFTIEAYIDANAVRPNGVGILCDELSTMFTNMTAYSKASPASKFISAWGGDDISSHRKSGDSIVRKSYMPIFGAIQPKILSTFATEANKESGFTDRWCLIFCDKEREYETDYVIDDKIIKAYDAFIRLLYTKINDSLIEKDGYVESKMINFTPSSKKIIRDASNRLTDLEKSEEIDEYIKSIYSKQSAYLKRFALLFHIIDNFENNFNCLEISDLSATKAVLLSNFFLDEAVRAKEASSEDLLLKNIVAECKSNKMIDKIIHVEKANIKYSTKNLAELLQVSQRHVQNTIKKWKLEKELNKIR